MNFCYEITRDGRHVELTVYDENMIAIYHEGYLPSRNAAIDVAIAQFPESKDLGE